MTEQATIRTSKRPYKKFSKQERRGLWQKMKSTYSWSADINYREQPDKYQVGKGEQGVLICEPYKSEILPYWRFKTPQVAKESSEKIEELFKKYLKEKDFVGADMARKYLQMGYTRARRYASHKGGRKYDALSGEELPLNVKDRDKEESAAIFYQLWRKAESNTVYKEMKKKWKQQYG